MVGRRTRAFEKETSTSFERKEERRKEPPRNSPVHPQLGEGAVEGDAVRVDGGVDRDAVALDEEGRGLLGRGGGRGRGRQRRRRRRPGEEGEGRGARRGGEGSSGTGFGRSRGTASARRDAMRPQRGVSAHSARRTR